MGSSFVCAQPSIEEGRPTLINRSGSGVLADDLVTDDQLRQRITALQNELSGEYATQDGLTQLLDRLLQLEREVQSLRGDVEVLNERLRRSEEQSRERYVELDRRMTSLQASIASGGPALVQEPPASDPVEDPGAAEDDYRLARNLIADREYEQAVEALNEFIENYPDSGLTGDALYWLGEVHTLLREYDNARTAYQQLLGNYPESQRRPDALFKLGFIAERVSEPQEAISYYEQVLDLAPDSSLADLAEDRISSIQSGG